MTQRHALRHAFRQARILQMLCIRTGQPLHVLLQLSMLQASVLAQRGRMIVAERVLRIAIEKAQPIANSFEGMPELYRMLARVLAERDPAESRRYHELATAAAEEIFSPGLAAADAAAFMPADMLADRVIEQIQTEGSADAE